MAELQELEEQTQRVHRGLNQMMQGAGVVAAGTAILAPLAIATNAAGDLNETLNKNQVVFEDQAAAILDWAGSSATAFGQSRQAAIESAATLGNLFVSMDIGRGSARRMSTDLVQLASDMASLNNTPIEQAFEAIRSGMVGESEPLRAYGVVLSEAAIQQQAFAMGLTKKAKDSNLSPAIKAMATYQLILDKTAKTTKGDYARSALQMANAQKTIRAQTQNAWAYIGQFVLPTVTRLTNMVSGMIGRFNAFAERHPHITKALVLTAAAIGGVLVVGGSLLVLMGALNVAWGAAAGGLVLLRNGLAAVRLWLTLTAGGYIRNLVWIGAWASANTAAQWAALSQATGLRAVQLALLGARISLVHAATAAWAFTASLLANPVTWIVLGVVALGAALYGVFRLVGRFRDLFTGAINKVLYGLGFLVGLIGGGLLRGLRGLVNLMTNLGTMLIQGLVKGIKLGAKAVWGAVKNVATGLLDRFKGFFGIRSPSRVFAEQGGHLMDGLSEGMEKRSPALFRFLTNVLGPKIMGAFQRGWTNVKTFGGNFIGGVGRVLSGAGQALGLTGGAGSTAPAASTFNLGSIQGGGAGAKIARAAVQGLTAGWAESIPGYCSRFVRQVFNQVLGPQTQKLFGSSAINTEKVWKAQGLTRTLAEIGGKAALKAGDVLFQGFGSGGYGHTGVYVGNGMVAQNTTAAGGGKKLLPLSSFGTITSVGRIPAPAAPRPSGAGTGGQGQSISIGNVHLPNVTKPDEFLTSLRRTVEFHQ